MLQVSKILKFYYRFYYRLLISRFQILNYHIPNFLVFIFLNFIILIKQIKDRIEQTEKFHYVGACVYIENRRQ